MAAAYAFHLRRNHPFLDGNKRTAAAAMGTFLAINGERADFDEAELAAAIEAVADGRWGKPELTSWLRGRRRTGSR